MHYNICPIITQNPINHPKPHIVIYIRNKFTLLKIKSYSEIEKKGKQEEP